MKYPVVELSECLCCEICCDLCPEVFVLNDAGYVAVTDLPAYPAAAVDEAIKNCPTSCIYWEEKGKPVD